MALLELKKIGKIYASANSIAVGIRGVDLAFERGEFVAVTGESGSGKSTLLNVISGMDTYEEGELIIDGEPTSHYSEKDWELYREKYISFIFQDYNILESFTVLQNVEMALLHIEDPKERRRRALELLDRVGLSDHLHSKGSKLSGGQKQRTVIARALAKDSPIILADEPTGNLDSASAKEIIALLEQISREKLLIIVTHNEEEVEAVATRFIRVYNGAVASDRLTGRKRCADAAEASCGRQENGAHEGAEEKTGSNGIVPAGNESAAEPVMTPAARKARKRKEIRNGKGLGKALFFSKPKLSIFLCLLLILGALGLFGVTGLCGEIPELLKPATMFTPYEGRVVVTREDGHVLSENELRQLKRDYGAVSARHYDLLMDQDYTEYLTAYCTDSLCDFGFRYVTGEKFSGPLCGSYPKEENEVLLYLPIGYQPDFGKNELKIHTIFLEGTGFRISGVQYYYDNNQDPKLLLTEDGFEVLTAIWYLKQSMDAGVSLSIGARQLSPIGIDFLTACFGLPSGAYYVNQKDFRSGLSQQPDDEAVVTFFDYRRQFEYYSTSGSTELSFTYQFPGRDRLLDELPENASFRIDSSDEFLLVGTDLIIDIAESEMEQAYCQASLFFENEEAAAAAAGRLRTEGYIAVPSSTVYTPPIIETVANTALGVFLIILWALTVIFLAFVIHLCSSKAVETTKSDLAILRSMGIPVRTIVSAMYVRMYLAMIPAILSVILAAFMMFAIPKVNDILTYLYLWQYLLIFVGLFLITTRVTGKQIGRLFSESVKNALRGGNEE